MMRRYLGHMIATMLAAVVFFASCGKDEGEVIPRKDLAKIYAEMLMTDQWIMMTPNVRLIADTSLVYAPIMERYGYDREDYARSVDHYMNDPERFSKILRETGEILEARLKDLELRKEELERLEKLREAAEKYRPDTKWDELYPERPVRNHIGPSDSLSVEWDSLGRAYRLSFVERTDTVYDGVAMILPAVDTAAVSEADTLLAADADALVEPMVLPKEKRKLIAPEFMKSRHHGKK